MSFTRKVPTRAAEWIGTPKRKPWKKALLVGIQYEHEGNPDDETVNALNGPHQDAAAMRDLIIDTYSYKPENVVVLIDTDEPGQIQPIRSNMLRAIQELVYDAQPGDHFFFHYAGHTVQVPARGLSEEDGLDECIVPSDGEDNLIKDNELRRYLVDPLPVGCNLVAVFDSCHSGSLLDLEHFRCNRVYVPWISKGRRRSDTRWNNIMRRRAAWPDLRRTQSTLEGSLVVTRHIYQNTRSSEKAVRSRKTSIEQLLVKVDNVKRLTIETAMRDIRSDEELWYGTENTPIARTMSPEGLWPCTGWCPPTAPRGANVISIAASKDYQLSWEDRDGGSMTKALIKVLKSNPHPTLSDLMKDISHELHKFYLFLHPASREYRRNVRDINRKRIERGLEPHTLESPPEMNNFQDPELSSPVPLPPGTKWDP